jgi:glycosyl-4,4'-diaponeurosporenoate acyltransferase
VTLALPAAVAVDAAAWCAAQVTAGYAVHRLPDAWLDVDRRLFRTRPFERDGRFYRTRLHVPRWKRLLPEGGAVFRGGVDKRALGGGRPEDLVRYRRETRRAELGHWLAMAPLPLFALWNPPGLWPAMAAYAVAVNLPCIVSQRYNRVRIERVLSRANGSRSSPAARRRSAAGTIGSSIP